MDSKETSKEETITGMVDTEDTTDHPEMTTVEVVGVQTVAMETEGQGK